MTQGTIPKQRGVATILVPVNHHMDLKTSDPGS